MYSFGVFERELQDALNHFYDPAYQQTLQTLGSLLGIESGDDVSAVQRAIAQSIRELKPAEETPPAARAWRFYNILVLRYIRGMTQDETAEQIGITPRHLRREQNSAIHYLAQYIWRKNLRDPSPDLGFTEDPLGVGNESTSPDWLSQVKEEVFALQKASGQSLVDIATTIDGVIKLVSPLAEHHQVSLRKKDIQSGLKVRIQPGALHQILVQTISDMVRNMDSGEIIVNAFQDNERIIARISGIPLILEGSIENRIVDEILLSYGASINFSVENQRLSIDIMLPAGTVTVLVIDDNPDLIHFYKRYVHGTRYQIVPLSDGSQIFEVIEHVLPDIIVLDIMLPFMDGWELISRLHALPATKSIPIIICSVVRDEELAMVLGAARYLPKPVRRQDFIRALDEVSTPLQKDP